MLGPLEFVVPAVLLEYVILLQLQVLVSVLLRHLLVILRKVIALELTGGLGLRKGIVLTNRSGTELRFRLLAKLVLLVVLVSVVPVLPLLSGGKQSLMVLRAVSNAGMSFSLAIDFNCGELGVACKLRSLESLAGEQVFLSQ